MKRKIYGAVIAAAALVLLALLGLDLLIRLSQGTESVFGAVSELEPQIILWPESTDLNDREDTEVTLHFRIPQEWPLSEISVQSGGGETLARLSPQMLLPSGDTVTISDTVYEDYSAVVTVPGRQEGDDATAASLCARMGANESSPILLYRQIAVTEEMTEQLCDTLQDLSDYMDRIEPISEDPSADEVNALLKEAETYLASHENVASVWQASDSRIRFVTTDGLCGFFQWQDANYCGGGGTEETQGSYLTEVRMDRRPGNVCINSNVLVMCPWRGVDSERSGDIALKVGKDLANTLGGVRGYTDGSGTAQVIASGSLKDYGTVMFTTHSDYMDRDNSGDVSFSVYASLEEDSEGAKTARSALLEAFSELDMEKTKNRLLYVKTDSAEGGTGVLVEYGLLSKQGGGKYYGVAFNSLYLKCVYADAWFPNTVFYLGSCRSFRDDSLNRFLIQHGASCVIGYHGTVQCPLEEHICADIFQTMQEKSSSSHSGQNAFVRSKSIEAACTFANRGNLEKASALADLIYDGSITCSWHGNWDFGYWGEKTMEGTVWKDEKKKYCAPGVEVTAWRYLNDELQPAAKAFTLDDGTFYFPEMPMGVYVIEACSRADEAVTHEIFRLDSAPTHAELTLNMENQRQNYKIRVIDGVTGEPIDGAQIVLSQEIGTSDWEWHLTDSDGYYEYTVSSLADLDGYPILVRADGYEEFWDTVRPDAGVQTVELMPSEENDASEENASSEENDAVENGGSSEENALSEQTALLWEKLDELIEEYGVIRSGTEEYADSSHHGSAAVISADRITGLLCGDVADYDGDGIEELLVIRADPTLVIQQETSGWTDMTFLISIYDLEDGEAVEMDEQEVPFLGLEDTWISCSIQFARGIHEDQVCLYLDYYLNYNTHSFGTLQILYDGDALVVKDGVECSEFASAVFCDRATDQRVLENLLWRQLALDGSCWEELEHLDWEGQGVPGSDYFNEYRWEYQNVLADMGLERSRSRFAYDNPDGWDMQHVYDYCMMHSSELFSGTNGALTELGGILSGYGNYGRECKTLECYGNLE